MAPEAGVRYRTAIYGTYVHGRQQSLTPTSVAGLESRGPHLRKLIREYFPADRNAAILDLGCGHGDLLHFARQAGYRNLRGVDGSAEQVSEAQRLGIEGVAQGDVMETLRACPSGSLEAVIAFDLLEHFRKDELLELARETCRVLAEGGVWLLHLPNGGSPFFGRMQYHDFTHETVLARGALEQLAHCAGFRQLRCYEDRPVPHGPASSVRWLLWLGIRSLLRLWLATETGSAPADSVLTQNLYAVATK